MRCLHCYDDIREAHITEYSAVDLLPGPLPSIWMSEHGSPFCMRAPCLTSVVHEIKHAPLPTV